MEGVYLLTPVSWRFLKVHLGSPKLVRIQWCDLESLTKPQSYLFRFRGKKFMHHPLAPGFEPELCSILNYNSIANSRLQHRYTLKVVLFGSGRAFSIAWEHLDRLGPSHSRVKNQFVLKMDLRLARSRRGSNPRSFQF